MSSITYDAGRGGWHGAMDWEGVAGGQCLEGWLLALPNDAAFAACAMGVLVDGLVYGLVRDCRYFSSTDAGADCRAGCDAQSALSRRLRSCICVPSWPVQMRAAAPTPRGALPPPICLLFRARRRDLARPFHSFTT